MKKKRYAESAIKDPDIFTQFNESTIMESEYTCAELFIGIGFDCQYGSMLHLAPILLVAIFLFDELSHELLTKMIKNIFVQWIVAVLIEYPRYPYGPHII
ncbi:MAG: hypothetical protein IPK08_13365 [Bacteroidetes bacterium]|nr:hypothetical protein [Bacteroidota bacterium]